MGDHLPVAGKYSMKEIFYFENVCTRSPSLTFSPLPPFSLTAQQPFHRRCLHQQRCLCRRRCLNHHRSLSHLFFLDSFYLGLHPFIYNDKEIIQIKTNKEKH